MRRVPLPQGGERAGLYLDEELAPGEASAEEREIAEAALACAPGEPLYARVDLLGGAVLELELTEPSLYFEFGAGSADRLARPSRQGSRRYADRVTMTDTFGRPLRDLRISVTDRCNFRCVYCMPKEVFGREYEFLGREELLTFEEIERIARVFVAGGVEKIRITGGEPLVRRDLPVLVGKLAALGDVDLTLTTNGALLARQARATSPAPA